MRLFIHPLFILTAVVAVFFTVVDFFVALTIAVILHEAAHALIARKIGAIVSHITLAPFGGTLKMKTTVLTKEQKRLIYLAGPLASLLFSMLFGVVVWLWPVIFNYLEYLVVANFLVGIINLIPIYPLDGGKVLSLYLPTKFIVIFSNLFFVGILLFGIVTFRWWWIFFAVIMLIQINWDFKQSLYYDKFSFVGKIKTGKFVRCAVILKMSLWSIYRLVDPKNPTEFIITDYNYKIFYEKDLEQWLLKYDNFTTLEHCL